MSGLTASGGLTLDFSNIFVTNITITGDVFTDWQNSPSYDDDAAAAAGGVAVGELYRNGNFIMVRLS